MTFSLFCFLLLLVTSSSLIIIGSRFRLMNYFKLATDIQNLLSYTLFQALTVQKKKPENQRYPKKKKNIHHREPWLGHFNFPVIKVGALFWV